MVPVPPRATLKTDWLFNSPLMLVTTPVAKEPIVVEPEGPITNRLAPLEEATAKGLTLEYVEVPWTYRVAWGEVVPIPTLWLAVAIRIETPVEEVIANGFKVPTPLMLKEMVEDVAFTPATVPLSISVPKVRPVEEAQVTT